MRTIADRRKATMDTIVLPARRDHRALVLAARDGGERSRDELTNLFMPRITYIARDYRHVQAVSRDELIQAGVLGLLRALRRWDPGRENQFWSYAQWWVRQAMQELVSSQSGVVMLSDRALRQLAKVNTARQHHLQSQGREPSTGDLAKSTGLRSAQVMLLVGAAQPARTLEDRPDTSPRPLVESLPDPAGEDAFELAALRAAAGTLPAALATLTPREQTIVCARYGLNGETRSLRAIGAELHVSPERIRQVERRAMEKLRECIVPGVAEGSRASL